jgi:putative transposase
MNHSKESLSHTRWECKYHVVFIPKYRKKSIYGWVRKELGPIMRGLAQQKEVVVEEGHLMADHVHMLLSIPPKYSVSGVQGEERDSDRPAVYGSGEELCRAEFLGEGILRIDGGSRRGADPQLHQRARERG